MSAGTARQASRAASAPRAATSRPAAPRTRPAERPALALVPPPRPGPRRAPFVLLVLAILSAGLMALLALNTALAQGSFTVGELTREKAELAEAGSSLEEALARAQSPDRLAAAARNLGMVPERDPAYIRLADGSIHGRASAAKAEPRPLTPEERAAAAAAAEAVREAEAAERAAERAAAEAAARAAAEKAAKEKAEREAAQRAAAAEKAWRDKLADQVSAGPRSGGETVIVPPPAPKAP